jgi:nicotinate phosphoribosyltransferase
MNVGSDHAQPGAAPLLTDLYQLAMCQSYWREGLTQTAVFEFFVRRLHRRRNFLLACGLEQVLDYLQGLAFAEEEIDWLRSTGKFDLDFLSSLVEFRFEGDVDAVPEGTAFFPDEPILRVTAPLPQGQFVESRIVNLLHYQTLVAAKAARMMAQAPMSLLIDFGMRRAHGGEAALLGARAAYIAGFSGSATLEAQRRFGVPAFGTMAHSFIQAHDSERDAFLNFARTFPDNVILLLDTYDTERAARSLKGVADELAKQAISISGVRLDSGDLIDQSRRVRIILDAAHLAQIKIFASSNVDEDLIARTIAAKAPIDGFGVGTNLTTSSDVPFLDCAYKLQEYAGRARRKRSSGKATWPGRKQIYRSWDVDGKIRADILGIEGEAIEGEALLVPVMRRGRRVQPAEPLDRARDRARQNLSALPRRLLALERETDEPLFRPRISPGLIDLAAKTDRAIDQAQSIAEDCHGP